MAGHIREEGSHTGWWRNSGAGSGLLGKTKTGRRKGRSGGLLFGSRRDQSEKEGQLWMGILLLRVKKGVYSVAWGARSFRGWQSDYKEITEKKRVAAGEFEVNSLLILIDIFLIYFLFGLLHVARRFGLGKYGLYVVCCWFSGLSFMPCCCWSHCHFL